MPPWQGFDPNAIHAALQIQDFYRKSTQKTQEASAARRREKKARPRRAIAEKKNRVAEEAKAKAEQGRIVPGGASHRAAVAKADRAHLQALHADRRTRR